MRVGRADVWLGKWIVVVLDDGRFDAVVEPVGDVGVGGIDMPIGLPKPGKRREADQLAREYVGPRWRPVFIAPSSDLLAAETHAKANQLAASEGIDGLGPRLP